MLMRAAVEDVGRDPVMELVKGPGRDPAVELVKGLLGELLTDPPRNHAGYVTRAYFSASRARCLQITASRARCL